MSNNGRGKYKIDPHTGLLTTSGKLNAGEQYSITVQATDSGGKMSQTIVEVTVVPGPNTRSPVFTQPVYDLQVSEGASINSTVATIMAIDPEKDPVTYSILTGNDLRQFAVGYKSGVITVIRKLDREDLTRYQLVSFRKNLCCLMEFLFIQYNILCSAQWNLSFIIIISTNTRRHTVDVRYSLYDSVAIELILNCGIM